MVQQFDHFLAFSWMLKKTEQLFFTNFKENLAILGGFLWFLKFGLFWNCHGQIFAFLISKGQIKILLARRCQFHQQYTSLFFVEGIYEHFYV